MSGPLWDSAPKIFVKTPAVDFHPEIPAMTSEQPILAFRTAAEFSRWLKKNHHEHPGLWLRLYKKASDTPTVTYAEALDEALCYGWIDGQKKSYDAESWLQRFTRRSPRSGWSKINTGHIERLGREGRLQPAGLAAVEAAKADGRWEQAYHSPRNSEPPEDFLQAVAKIPKAQAFYDTLNKTNRYAISYRLQTAKKPETRAKRLKDILGMLQRGEKFH